VGEGQRAHERAAGLPRSPTAPVAVPEAPYRFVNYVEWETADLWRDAHDEEFRRLVSDPGWQAFPTTPALYEIVHEGVRS
jgi:hypothetical protein